MRSGTAVRSLIAGLLLTAAAALPAPLSAQLGTSSLAPDWAEEPKVYATTAALWADSLGLAWDGEAPITLRFRVLELVAGEPDRYVAGGTILMEPGSRLIVLQELMPAAMLGQGAEILRWGQGWSMPGTFLHPSGWDPKVLAASLKEELAVDWSKEAVLVLGMTAVEEGDLREVDIAPLFLVRPYVAEPAELATRRR